MMNQIWIWSFFPLTLWKDSFMNKLIFALKLCMAIWMNWIKKYFLSTNHKNTLIIYFIFGGFAGIIGTFLLKLQLYNNIIIILFFILLLLLFFYVFLLFPYYFIFSVIYLGFFFCNFLLGLHFESGILQAGSWI